MEEHLFRHVVIGVELHLRLCIECALARRHVIAVDGAGNGERREGIEAFLFLLVTCESHTAHGGKSYLTDLLAVETVEVRMVGGILAIGENHLSVDDLHIIQHVLLFTNQLLPVTDTRFTDVCRHDAVLRGVQVGEQVNLVTICMERRISVLHVCRHLDKLTVGFAEVTDKQHIAGTGTVLVKEHHRFLVVGGTGIETLGIGSILIEQHILRLRCPYLMIVNLMPLVDIR